MWFLQRLLKGSLKHVSCIVNFFSIFTNLKTIKKIVDFVDAGDKNPFIRKLCISYWFVSPTPNAKHELLKFDQNQHITLKFNTRATFHVLKTPTQFGSDPQTVFRIRINTSLWNYILYLRFDPQTPYTFTVFPNRTR